MRDRRPDLRRRLNLRRDHNADGPGIILSQASAPELPPSDVEPTFKLQQAASRCEPALGLAERLRALSLLRALVTENEGALSKAISTDFGVRARAETELLEIVPTLNAGRYARRHLASWMKLRRAHVADRFDASQVAVLSGGVETAEALSSLPLDHLLFTGSTAVGRKVMQAAAANLTPVTLELGGKSPAIVRPDYPIGKAARSIAFGKFVNAGQTCIAPDYMLVPAGNAQAFAQSVMVNACRSYPKIAGNDDYSSMMPGAPFERSERRSPAGWRKINSLDPASPA